MTLGARDVIFLSILGVAASFSVLGTLLFILHRGRQRPEPDDQTPVTVLKPLAGIFPGLVSSLESFFRQTHRGCQIVIGVRSREDPALEVAESLCRDHPDVDARIVIGGGPDLGLNRKVSNLHFMMAVAKHELLVISDDDVRVDADYVARMVGALRDPSVGVATSPYWVRPRSLGLALDGLTRATELLPSVVVAERLDRGLSFTLGASSIVRRMTLEDIGGLQSMADYLAEDYLLGAKARAKGWKVSLSTEAVELGHNFRSLGEYFGHQLRWSRTYRFCRPLGYFLSILTHGVSFGVLYVLVSGATRPSLLAAGACVGVRVLTAGADILLGGHPSLLAWLPLLPVRDLLSTLFWVASFVGRTVRWRDRAFRLGSGGRLELAD
jgi:ceramide glucosyltransferase